MAYYIAPGVKFNEIDLSEYAPALSTSVLGIVGTATKGPINEPTYITGAEQFIKTFGQPTPDSYMPYAALEFLQRGRAMWVVRVCGGSYNGSPYTSANKAQIVTVTGADTAAVILGANEEYFTITEATGGTHTGTEIEQFTLTSSNNAYKFTTTTPGGSQSGTITPGTYTASSLASALNSATTGLTFADDGTGKLKVTLDATGSSENFSIDTVASDMYTVVGWTKDTYDGSDGTDSLSVTLTGTGAGTQTFTLTAGVRSASQIAVTINATSTNFTAAADDLGRVKLTKDQTGTGESLKVDAVSTADTVLGFDNTTHDGSASGATTLTLKAKSEGTWANAYYAIIAAGTEVSDSFKLDLYNADGLRVETFDNMVKDSASDNFHETILSSGSDYIESVDVADVNGVPTPGTYTLAAGVNGISDVASADYIGAITTTGDRTGLELFSNPNNINVNIIIVPGVTAQAVQNKIISVCEVDRKDSIAILDTPYGLNVQGAVNFMNGEGAYAARTSLSSSYACIYWPWIKIYDNYNPTAGTDSDGYIWVPASGFAAAAMAYTDYSRDPWFPPAGPERGRIISALGIEYNCEEGDIILMYGTPNNLNPIVEKDNIIQIFGQKTLQRTASSKDRIGTRRMLLYSQRVVSSTLNNILWEPNDEVTWRRFVRVITPIFQTIKDRRGLYDFRVICDETTNTSDLINQNTVLGKILMQHIKYSEIIIVDFVSTPTGVNFSEVEY